jgi:hypothetical protein
MAATKLPMRKDKEVPSQLHLLGQGLLVRHQQELRMDRSRYEAAGISEEALHIAVNATVLILKQKTVYCTGGDHNRRVA